MYKTAPSKRLPQRQRRFLHLFVLLGFLCLSFLGTTIASTMTTYADSRPGGNVTDPVIRAVDIAEPAVVRIFTTLGGHLTVHFSTTSNVTFPQGTGSNYPLQLSGSGTFISAHGDILTADHVINPPHDQSLSQYLDTLAASDVAAYINQNAKAGSQVTTSQVSQELQSGQLPSDPSYDPASSEVFLNTTYTGPLSASSFQNVPDSIHAPIDRIEKESAVNEADVAIVHVSMNDMPSVQLGDSSNVQQQDVLSIIGFPGNGDVSVRPTDILTASINTINVSSIKTSDSGAQVIQVGGNVEHGDSGGPALDNTGAVVGIVSFGLSSGNSPGGTSFLQASNSARTLVQSLNLNTTPGAFQKAWSQAFTDYAATSVGHWHKAEQEFAKLATSYPQFKAITPFLTYTQNQAKNERTTSTTPQPKPSTQNAFLAYVLTIGAILVLLLLVVVMFRVVYSNRKKKAPVSDATGKGRPVSNLPQTPLPATSPGNSSIGPTQPQQVPLPSSHEDDGMTAFGAPPRTIQQIAQPVPGGTTMPPSTIVSGTLRPWPCGHLNRSNARFCSICGEPAPPPTTRRFEP